SCEISSSPYFQLTDNPIAYNSCISEGAKFGASYTPRKVSGVSFVFSILFVLSRGGSMSLDTFLPSILLLVVIIVTVVVTVVVVVAGGVPYIVKLSFVIIGSLHRTML
ncbi:hypothetical protein Tco_1389609, partial [Tanacetum coccineum]